MPIMLQKEYLKNIRERYKNSTKKFKSYILTEFCLNTRYSRKHASRILNEKLELRVRRSGPPNTISFCISPSRTMGDHGASLRQEYEGSYPALVPKSPEKYPEGIEKKLRQVSAATMDRLLSPFNRIKPKGLSITKASHLKYRIPMRTLDSKAKLPALSMPNRRSLRRKYWWRLYELINSCGSIFWLDCE